MENLIRRLQYRVRRQGTLELDVWLSSLTQALKCDDPEVIQAIECLVQHEVPELLAMQAGQQSVPEILKPWLSSK